VVKGVAAGLVHKSNVGAVRLQLSSGDAVASAAAEVLAELQEGGYRRPELLVEAQLPRAPELLVSVRADAVHGALLILGSGGVWTELVGDMTAELLPTTTARLGHVLRGLRCWPLLRGYRSGPAVDIEALVDGIGRLAEAGLALVRDGDLTEIEFNPVMVHEGRVWVVDAVAYRAATDDAR
jgi:succinyl-CoA synthetase beta subunit